MSVDTKFTAGPWSIENPSADTPHIWIVSESNPGICKIETCNYDDGKGERLTDEDVANARLIAHAPETVAALSAAIGYMMNAMIDLETGTKKATTIATLQGGIRKARQALDAAVQS